jgi:large subunit ribosomal protein L25
MDTKIVNAATRTTLGKRAARQLRLTGKIPAVMYNEKGEATSLTIDEKEFARVRKTSTPTTLVNLLVDEKDAGIAFIRDTEYDIKTDKNLHADFFLIPPTRQLKLRTRVSFSGTPQGVREGGRLVTHNSEITISCVPGVLPERIVEDISNLAIGDVLRVKDLHLDKKIEVLTSPEAPLISILAADAKK